MYFIYPASVSENCDKRIIPAVAKCIERFFLLQLQDAIASGVLPLSRRFDGRNYGPILLECVKNYNEKQMLTESGILLEKKNNGNKPNNNNGNKPNNNKPKGHTNAYNIILRNIYIVEDQLNKIRKNDPNAKAKFDDVLKNINTIGTGIQCDRGIRQDERSELVGKLASLSKAYSSAYDAWVSLSRKNNKDDRSESRQDDKDEQDRIDREERKRKEEEKEEEEKARERSMAHTGSYIPMDSKIDIVPTCGTVRTNILYKGGTLNGKTMESVDFNINVKVIPTIIKNFKVLENDLLNDYFSKKSESYFKTKGRNIARQSYNILKRLPFGMGDAIWKIGMTIAGEDVEQESKKDIIYNTQGFVNASAFHKSGSSPNNYNFTSNVVIFNKDDLTDPDDSNIFQNRSAMVRLFKMGWSTFCMLDPVEEVMYFISSLDGGYMHVVPYRYIMESYGSKAYYGTETKLKDSAKPFMIKRGNFNTFAQQFLKKRK